MDNKLIFSAGILALFTSFLHLIGGQFTLVDPMLGSNMIAQAKVEWLGAWHCITILLFGFGYVLIKNGLNYRPEQKALIILICQLSVLFSLAFILASLYMQKHAPQYILFLPIALLIFSGLKKVRGGV